VAEDGREYYAISKEFDLKEAWDRYEIKDGNPKSEKDYWIRLNILLPIFEDLRKTEKDAKLLDDYSHDGTFRYKNVKRLIEKYGKTKKEIASDVEWFCSLGSAWSDFENKAISSVLYYREKTNQTEESIVKNDLKTVFDEKPVFYGYYSAYDWVALCWLFGKMIDLPKNFPSYCHDVKPMLDWYVGNTYFKRQLKGVINQEEIEGETFEWVKGESDLKGFYDFMKAEAIFNKEWPDEPIAHNALLDARYCKQLYEFIKRY
jgi:hypothetical protein